jgi:hypothetical protein
VQRVKTMSCASRGRCAVIASQGVEIRASRTRRIVKIANRIVA